MAENTQIETQETQETQETPKAIRIGDKFYAPESITEKVVNLLKDISTVETEIGSANLRLNITQLAKAKLIDELTKELPTLTEVPAPEAE